MAATAARIRPGVDRLVRECRGQFCGRVVYAPRPFGVCPGVGRQPGAQHRVDLGVLANASTLLGGRGSRSPHRKLGRSARAYSAGRLAVGSCSRSVRRVVRVRDRPVNCDCPAQHISAFAGVGHDRNTVTASDTATVSEVATCTEDARVTAPCWQHPGDTADVDAFASTARVYRNRGASALPVHRNCPLGRPGTCSTLTLVTPDADGVQARSRP